ncbi:MAG: AmmeMemoRadiSam system protein B [Propionicimonas sp.]|nr:AmmeMemoRadiSam system protein B [Propionicimonas sp.]
MATTIRPPAVAGRFYPGQAEHLASTVERLLADARAASAACSPPKALIVPHAGYVYSGSTAAAGYVTLDPVRDQVTRVVMLGPAHHVWFSGLALAGADSFATPLGTIELDPGAEAALAQLPQVIIHPGAHAQEHSLEVQLPFLQAVLNEFQLVPLVVGNASPRQVAEVLEALWGGSETVVVISSDLSHYLPYPSARRIDRTTVQQILDLDWPLTDGSACGARGINGLLVAAAERGLRPHLISMCNSGDTAGDRSRVVGNAAIAFEELTDFHS